MTNMNCVAMTEKRNNVVNAAKRAIDAMGKIEIKHLTLELSDATAQLRFHSDRSNVEGILAHADRFIKAVNAQPQGYNTTELIEATSALQRAVNAISAS